MVNREPFKNAGRSLETRPQKTDVPWRLSWSAQSKPPCWCAALPAAGSPLGELQHALRPAGRDRRHACWARRQPGQQPAPAPAGARACRTSSTRVPGREPRMPVCCTPALPHSARARPASCQAVFSFLYTSNNGLDQGGQPSPAKPWSAADPARPAPDDGPPPRAGCWGGGACVFAPSGCRGRRALVEVPVCACAYFPWARL